MERYHDCIKHTTEFNGREVILVEPKQAAPGKPWIWRAEYFDISPFADIALLEQGWHIAYYKVSNMYGCPAAIELMKAFHDAIVPQYGLNPKADLFGFSRGGLYATNYALKYPADVRSLYLDAPVLDIRSWPAGLYHGDGSPYPWEECKRYYHLTDETAPAFSDNPIDHADQLIATKIPVIMVVGDADTLVPYDENGLRLKQAYEKAGAPIKVICKKGAGHHPHSLENPEEIVDFIKNV